MGKFVIAILAITFQAVLGDVPKRFTDHGGELGAIFQQIVTVSENIHKTVHNAPTRSGSLLPHRKFEAEIEEIVDHLEELPLSRDEKTNTATLEVIKGLRQIAAHLKEMQTVTDDALLSKLETTMATTILNVVRNMEPWIKFVESGKLDASSYSETKKILRAFDFTLNRVYESFTTDNLQEKSRDKRYNYGESQNTTEIVRDFEVLLEQFNTDKHEIKLAFLQLARGYLNDIRQYATPEFDQYYLNFLNPNASLYSGIELKSQLRSIIKSFVATKTTNRAPSLAFNKATRTFKNNLDMMAKINTPTRILALRIYSVSEALIDGYESKPYQVPEIARIIANHSQKLSENLQRFVAEIEETKTHCNLTTNLRTVSSQIQRNPTQPEFILALQEASSEVLKYLMVYPDRQSGGKFLDILNEVISEIFQIDEYVTRIETWWFYLLALTNRMGMIVNDDVTSDDITALMGNVTESLGLIDTESSADYKESSLRLKNAMAEFETGKYPINTFLQKMSLELNRMSWNIQKKTGIFPKKLMDIQGPAMVAMELMYPDHCVTRGLLTVQTPAEIALESQTVADRLNRILHLMVPGFQKYTLVRRTDSFRNLLDIVTFRLNKITVSNGKTYLINEAYRNLLEIQHRIEDLLKKSGLHVQVGFGMYVQEAVTQLIKMSSESDFDHHPDIVQMYGDFLFGIRNILNQVQYDFQFMTEHYSVKTLNMQIGYVAHYTSGLIHRIKSKPQLKGVVLVQVEAIAQLSEEILSVLMSTSDSNIVAELVTKYGRVAEQLRVVSSKGWEKSYEELCEFVDLQIREIVTDLEHLAYIGLEHPAIADLYEFTITLLSSTMARLENVNYYEYYNVVLNTQDVLGVINKLNVDLSNKLAMAAIPRQPHDVALQILQFSNGLEEVALRFNQQAKVSTKALYDIIIDLRRLGGITHIVGIDDLQAKLNTYTISVTSEIEKILTAGSLVGTKPALITYAVALEELNFSIDQSIVRSQKGETLYQVITSIDTGVHYLTKAIEHISANSNGAADVLRNEYRRLQYFILQASQELPKEDNLSEQLQSFFTKLSKTHFVNTNEVYDLKYRLVAILKYFPIVLRELSWSVPELRDHKSILTTAEFPTNKIFYIFFKDFLRLVQQVRYNIETRIIVQQVQSAKQGSGTQEDADKYYHGESDSANQFMRYHFGRYPNVLDTNYPVSGTQYAGRVSNQGSFNKYKVQEVTEYLNTVAAEKLNNLVIDQYILQLTQILDNSIEHLQGEETSSIKVQGIVVRFKRIKSNLQYSRTLSKFYQVQQISRSIKEVFNLYETLVGTAHINDTQSLNDVFRQFFNFVRRVKNGIEDSSSGENLKEHEIEPYHRKIE